MINLDFFFLDEIKREQKKTWNSMSHFGAHTIPKWFHSVHCMCAAHIHVKLLIGSCVFRQRIETKSVCFVCMRMFVQCVLLLFFLCILFLFFSGEYIAKAILSSSALWHAIALSFKHRRKQWHQFSLSLDECSDVLPYLSVNIIFESHKSIKKYFFFFSIDFSFWIWFAVIVTHDSPLWHVWKKNK